MDRSLKTSTTSPLWRTMRLKGGRRIARAVLDLDRELVAPGTFAGGLDAQCVRRHGGAILDRHQRF